MTIIITFPQQTHQEKSKRRDRRGRDEGKRRGRGLVGREKKNGSREGKGRKGKEEKRREVKGKERKIRAYYH